MRKQPVPISKEECDEVARRIASGENKMQIKKGMGIPPWRLFSIEKRLGKAAPRSPRSREHLFGPYVKTERMEQLAPHLTRTEFAKLFGISERRALYIKAQVAEKARLGVLRSNTHGSRCQAATPCGPRSTDTRPSSSGSSLSRTVDSSLIPRSRPPAV